MLRAVGHRGPDDEGITLISPETNAVQNLVTEDSAKDVEECCSLATTAVLPHRVALGHRRFSIIDLSGSAHQPFWSKDRQVYAAFNGEIYNYVELRDELARLGHVFRTDSDTEVLVEAYRVWGVECLKRFNGFWALTLYDADRKRVLLARDRIGKAPLYVTRCAEGIFWSSEIRGLMTGLGPAAFGIDAQAVDDFIRHGWRDLFNHTFYEGILTFPAACYAWIDRDGKYVPVSYWRVPECRRTERELSSSDAAAELRDLLADAVRIRMRADVPVGLDLSGGMDSSSIVALAVKSHAARTLRVFTISYPGSAYDELPYARKVVDRYRHAVTHTVLEPTNDNFLESLDSFVSHMHEPFHDLVLVGHHSIWRKMAETGIRVSLNGAAGDEVLAGYGSEYFEPYLRHLLCKGRWMRFLREFINYSEYEPSRFGINHLRRAYHLFPQVLRFYHNPAMDIPKSIDPYRDANGAVRRSGPSREINQLLIDYVTNWLMNYWCRSGNQNSMGVPLEFRCPFLDYRIVEYAFTLPVGYLIRDGWLKWILRKAMCDLLPGEIVWRRRKMGNRYPLRERLPSCREQFLSMLGRIECPYVDMAKLRSAYHEINRRNPDYLWRLLSVALWWKKCVQGESLISG